MEYYFKDLIGKLKDGRLNANQLLDQIEHSHFQDETMRMNESSFHTMPKNVIDSQLMDFGDQTPIAQEFKTLDFKENQSPYSINSKLDKLNTNVPTPRNFNANVLGAINSNREQQQAQSLATSNEASASKPKSKRDLKSISKEEAEKIKEQAHQKMIDRVQKLKDEQSEKEQEEYLTNCSFKPKINPSQVKSRYLSSPKSNGEPSLNKECTFTPNISRGTATSVVSSSLNKNKSVNKFHSIDLRNLKTSIEHDIKSYGSQSNRPIMSDRAETQYIKTDQDGDFGDSICNEKKDFTCGLSKVEYNGEQLINVDTLDEDELEAYFQNFLASKVSTNPNVDDPHNVDTQIQKRPSRKSLKKIGSKEHMSIKDLLHKLCYSEERRESPNTPPKRSDSKSRLVTAGDLQPAETNYFSANQAYCNSHSPGKIDQFSPRQYQTAGDYYGNNCLHIKTNGFVAEKSSPKFHKLDTEVANLTPEKPILHVPQPIQSPQRDFKEADKTTKGFLERQQNYEKAKQQRLNKLTEDLKPSGKPELSKMSRDIIKKNSFSRCSQRSEYFKNRKDEKNSKSDVKKKGPNKQSEEPKAVSLGKKVPAKEVNSKVEDYYKNKVELFLKKKEEKLEEQRMKKKNDELSEIREKPVINSENQAESKIGLHLDSKDYLSNIKEKEELKKQYAETVQLRKLMQETIECTHKPQINKDPKYLKKNPDQSISMSENRMIDGYSSKSNTKRGGESAFYQSVQRPQYSSNSASTRFQETNKSVKPNKYSQLHGKKPKPETELSSKLFSVLKAQKDRAEQQHDVESLFGSCCNQSQNNDIIEEQQYAANPRVDYYSSIQRTPKMGPKSDSTTHDDEEITSPSRESFNVAKNLDSELKLKSLDEDDEQEEIIQNYQKGKNNFQHPPDNETTYYDDESINNRQTASNHSESNISQFEIYNTNNHNTKFKSERNSQRSLPSKEPVVLEGENKQNESLQQESQQEPPIQRGNSIHSTKPYTNTLSLIAPKSSDPHSETYNMTPKMTFGGGEKTEQSEERKSLQQNLFHDQSNASEEQQSNYSIEQINAPRFEKVSLQSINEEDEALSNNAASIPVTQNHPIYYNTRGQTSETVQSSHQHVTSPVEQFSNRTILNEVIVTSNSERQVDSSEEHSSLQTTAQNQIASAIYNLYDDQDAPEARPFTSEDEEDLLDTTPINGQNVNFSQSPQFQQSMTDLMNLYSKMTKRKISGNQESSRGLP